jgi:hypothetical protein
MLPDFIIIGAMKGGTTSLFRYMASHPRIVRSSIKETDYFARNYHRGLDWYKTLFDRQGEYHFEASPNYTKHHIFTGVPQRMFATLPNVKLIYLLRDPIERIVSHYVHNCTVGRETRSFSAVVHDDAYVKTSMYSYQLEAYLEYYSRDSIFLISSEELWRNPIHVMGETLDFLKIPYEGDAARSEMNSQLLSPTVKKSVGDPRRVDRPTVSKLDRKVLTQVLAPDIDRLRVFCGRAFGEWSI